MILARVVASIALLRGIFFSMWREVDTSVCEAPVTYAGDCSRLLDISGMTEKDKYNFGVTCGARCRRRIHEYAAGSGRVDM